MQKTGKRGQGKTLPHKRKKLVYGMKDSQETMTKVIDRLLGLEGSIPCAWRVIYTLLHDNIFPTRLHFN